MRGPPRDQLQRFSDGCSGLGSAFPEGGAESGLGLRIYYEGRCTSGIQSNLCQAFV
jgi:hypothetical protein